MKSKAFAGILTLLLITMLFSVFPVPTSAADKTLRIGVIQPEGWPQGQGMKEGAELAAMWINDTGPGGGGGINVGGDRYFVQIRSGDEHASDLDIPAAEDEMRRLITVENCKFIYGGFRSECVFPIREIAMDYKTPYYICGAATNELIDDGVGGATNTVREDYARYRYLFRLTPINVTKLVYDILGFLRYVPGMSVLPLMASMFGDPVNTAVLAENLVWADGLYNAFVGGYLGPQANVVYQSRTPYGETNFVPYLDAMHAAKVRLMVIIYSAPDSITLMQQYAVHPIKAVPLGIDVLGQFQGHWVATAGGCEFEAFLATVGYRTPLAPEVTGVPSHPYTTREFFDLTVATYGHWPMYTSWGVYDGIIAMKELLEAADPADVKPYLDDPSTPWDGGSVIPYAEKTERYGIVAKFKHTGQGPHADLSEQDYATYTTDGGKTYLEINPTMKGITHDVFSNEYLHEWSKARGRALWAQWQAGKLEVVWPKYKTAPTLLSFWKRFLFPLRMWPYPLDLDYNGKVEMRDISLAARSFGSYPCHPRYDRGAALIVDDYPPGYDDEPVSMRDISAIARAFGTIYPLPVPY